MPEREGLRAPTSRASRGRGVSSDPQGRCPVGTCEAGRRIDGSERKYRDDLQRAVDELAARGGGLLWLPPNMTFFLSRPLTIRTGGIRIAGGGPSTVLALERGTPGSAIIEVQPSRSRRSGPVGLSDFRVEGLGRSVAGVWLKAPEEDVRLARLHIFRTGGPGIVVDGSQQPVVLDSVLVDSCLAGLRLSHSGSVSVISSRLDGSLEEGLWAESSQNVRLTLSDVVGSASRGAHLSGVDGFSAVGCGFIDNGWQDARAAVYAHGGSTGLTFTGCRFEVRGGGPFARGDSPARPGLRLAGTVGTLVLGCSFAGLEPPVQLLPATRRTTVLGDNIRASDIATPGSVGESTVRVGLDLEDPAREE